ncbi:hypothetical protein [Arthrobacter sp. Cr_A7]|uniref:hypothetical protein n=1 Tax=Arthrobacter sp. Cr_A7 TaxID=3031017 RepID=UPI0023DB52A7|nr:hypothetical protein [Arthrobacter sp. Cr_A7]MDF2050282.1 hypothetical protein [Arthrobacter sp. Cr_A7]
MISPRKLADFSAASLRQPIRQHHGAKYWHVPEYTNWIDESMSWKETCYIGDWSWLETIRYKGRDAIKLFADTSVNSVAKFQIGQSKHVIHCDDNGKIIEEGILTRTGEEEVIAHSTAWADYVARQGGYDVTSEVVGMTKFHVQGPNAIHLMERVSGRSLREAKFMRELPLRIGGHDVVALRQGMTGELGFELQAAIENGPEVWAAIVAEGDDFGLKEMGGRVAMINHLEACYPTLLLDYLPAIWDGRGRGYLKEQMESEHSFFDDYYGVAGSFESDRVADWYRSPIEFGWGNRINFDHEFPGSDALRAELKDPQRAISTLVWNSDDVMGLYASLFRKGTPLPDFMELPQDPRGYMYSDRVSVNGQPVGVSTSRGYSAYFREVISLCVIDTGHSSPGTQVKVLWGNPGTEQREIRATVAPAPYKKDRSRIDLSTLPDLPPRLHR